MEFNQDQQKIIDSIKGAFLVSAPVGTGKTTVLTERVVKALSEGFKPEEVLCLTFTNKAAEEMRGRLKARLKDKEVYDALTIATFHGWCADFIRQEAKELGVEPDFVIFDEDDSTELLEDVLAGYNQKDLKKWEVRNIGETLYKKQQKHILSEYIKGLSAPEWQKDELNIARDYKNALYEQNALDFNELVLITLRGILFNERLSNKWRQQYRLIQVDEFQDTHLSEYLVVKELGKHHGNLALIGDLDQTIYEWRGSDPKLIVRSFKSQFKPKELNLKINYRFEPGIMAAVQSVIANLSNRNTKAIESYLPGDAGKKCIEVFEGHNFREEMGWVIENIKEVHNRNKQARIAVLTRQNKLVSRAADVFVEKKIPHVTLDQFNFFRRQEIKDLLAHLRLIINKDDHQSAERMMERPAKGIGKATLEKIRDLRDTGIRLTDFLDFDKIGQSEPFADLIKKYNQGRIVVLDTETTGTNTRQDDIVQIYAREVVGGKPGKEFHHYIKPDKPVGSSEAVHRLSDEFLKEKGEDAAAILKQLAEFIGTDPIAGHNVGFDASMIINNGKRREVDFQWSAAYDTLDLARRLLKSANYRLGTLAQMLDLETATHSADDDVAATVGLLEKLIERLKPGQDKRRKLYGRLKPDFIKIANQLNNWRKKAELSRPPELLQLVWQESGLADHYAKDKDSQRRDKSYKTLLQLFQDKDESAEEPKSALIRLINFASLSKKVDFLGLEAGKVPIVTIHQVKGLEFDYVFIIGLNETIFPSGFNGNNLQEEERIFYVALTRAKKGVFLSYSLFNEWDRPMNKSRFLSYIDDRLVKHS